MRHAESEGSIRNQLGQTLGSMRRCIEAQDALTCFYLTRWAIVLASPYLSREKRDEIRPKHPDDALDEEEVFEECMVAYEALLPLMAQNGLYAWIESEPSDAGHLAEEASLG